METVKSTIQKTAQIEILVPRNTVTNQLIFPFPDQPFLRGKKISAMVMSVNTYSAQSGLLNVCAQLSLNVALSAIATNAVFVTLQDIHGRQVVQNMPILDLNPFNLAVPSGLGVGISKYNINGILALNPTEIVWTKSYLSVPTPAFTSPSAQDRGFQFSVFFN